MPRPIHLSTPLVRAVCRGLLAVAAFLLLTEDARAGRATVSGTRLLYADLGSGAAGAPAEPNDVTLSARDGALVIVESGAGVVPVAGDGCDVTETTVICRTADGARFSAANVNLAAGANRAAVAASVGELPISLTGADGADVLRGGPGPDVIIGGGGDDVIEGGDGEDVLFGDEGADQLQGDGGLDDFFGDEGDDVLRAVDGIGEVIDCGGGVDRVEADAVDLAEADCESRGAAGVVPGRPPDDDAREQLPPPGVAGPALGELRGLRVRSRCFYPGEPVSRARRSTCRRPTRGSALLVEATGAVAVVVGIQRVLPGRRAGPRCLPGRPRAAGRCRRYVRAALLRRTVPAGTTALGLTGRWPAALGPGLYRAALSVEVAGQPAGRRLFAFFRVVAAPPRDRRGSERARR